MHRVPIGVALATIAAALAGCGPAPEEAAQPANAANGVDVVATIANLSELEQQGVFFRAIRDAGLPCQDVVAVEAVEPMQGVPTWRAQCEDQSFHLIQVTPDGSARVTSRTGP